jgi:hypothetical protein
MRAVSSSIHTAAKKPHVWIDADTIASALRSSRLYGRTMISIDEKTILANKPRIMRTTPSVLGIRQA